MSKKRAYTNFTLVVETIKVCKTNIELGSLPMLDATLMYYTQELRTPTILELVGTLED